MTTVVKPDFGKAFNGCQERMAFAEASWHRAVGHLEDTGNLSGPRLEIADRYARVYAEFLFYHPQLADDGPVKKGKNNGDMYNILWTVVERLQDRLAKLEAKLGMDVASAEPGRRKPTASTASDEFLEY